MAHDASRPLSEQFNLRRNPYPSRTFQTAIVGKLRRAKTTIRTHASLVVLVSSTSTGSIWRAIQKNIPIARGGVYSLSRALGTFGLDRNKREQVAPQLISS